MDMFRLTRAVSAVLLLFIPVGTPAFAEGADAGDSLYHQFCAACHGEMGAGAGPIAALLTVPVPDLTHLSARNDGVFPMLDVIHTIDGRMSRAGHGGPMPIWGEVFATETASTGLYGSAIETRGRLMSLALYLESIQR